MISEALTFLRHTLEQDVLDGLSTTRLQKLANAAEKAFVDRALLLDENGLIFEQNNESRIRSSIKANVIGRAKVMSYDDIVEAQSRRDAKEAAAGENRRGPKRKSTKPVHVTAKRPRRNEAKVARGEIEALGLGNYCSALQF